MTIYLNNISVEVELDDVMASASTSEILDNIDISEAVAHYGTDAIVEVLVNEYGNELERHYFDKFQAKLQSAIKTLLGA